MFKYYVSSRETLLGSNFNTLLDNALEEEFLESSTTKRDYWHKIGESLIFAGYPRWELGTEIANRLENRFFEKYHYAVSVRSAHYYKCIQEWKWNRNFQPTAENEASNEAPSENFLEIPQPEKDSRTGVEDSSLYSAPNHAVENKRLIDILNDFTGMVYELRDYAQGNPFLSQVEDQTDLDDIFTRLNAWVLNCRDTLNNKQLVPINAQVMLLQIYNSASDINNLFGMFFDAIKKVHILDRTATKKSNQILTGKELKKYIRRELKSLSPLLEFQSPNEARMSGFYGQQCSTCGGYRTTTVDGNQNRVLCIKCNNREDFEIMKREFFLSCRRCGLLIGEPKSGRCEHCDFEYVVPKELR